MKLSDYNGNDKPRVAAASGTGEEPSPENGQLPGIRLQLEVFEGPLDLLLHLVRENRLDVYDIPIAKITEQYLAYIDVMKALNLDIAGEFLVMAATLLYIKSRSLLPRHEDDLELEEDPEVMRAELSRRLVDVITSYSIHYTKLYEATVMMLGIYEDTGSLSYNFV